MTAIRKLAAAMAGVALAACQTPPAAPAEPVALLKGYVIAEIEVTNPEPYRQYLAEVTPLVAKFGGTYIVRAGEAEVREGAALKGRLVVIAFPSLAAAKAFLDSPEYAVVAKFRQENAVSRVIVIEGYNP